MSDMEADDPRAEDGKIIPFRKSSPVEKIEVAVNGKSVPDLAALRLRPLPSGPFFFPKEQKQYYRTLLLELMKSNGIGVRKLRDLMMEPEDAKATRRHHERGGVGRAEDTRMTYEDLKKWLSVKSTHQLGDDKFQYVDRFVLHAIPFEWHVAVDNALTEARRKFHIAALRDMFQTKALRMELSETSISDHLVFAGQNGGELPGYVISLRGLDQGVGSLTILARKSNVADLEKENLRIIGRGFAVIAGFQQQQFRGTAYIDRTLGGHFGGDGFMDRAIQSLFIFSIGPREGSDLSFYINAPVGHGTISIGSERQHLSEEELATIKQFEKWSENG